MASIAPAGLGATSTVYSYAQTGDDNPDAVTQIADGSATSTFGWDAAGNLTSVVTGATSTTYGYNYLNQLTSIATNGATSTTFAYDAFGNRVSMTVGSTTTITPNKYYSIVSNTVGSTTSATSTEFLYDPGENGQSDTLIAEVLQKLVNGTATGTPTTYYVHNDNMGNVNVLSDASGTAQQVLSYYPYGGSLVNSGQNISSRQFEGLYNDPSGLIYSNARYYNPTQGQFTTEDPVFLSNPRQQNLQDPQSLNAYSYAEDNPITKNDPNGKRAALMASYGTGYFLGSESGPFDPIVGTVIGTALFASYEAYSNGTQGAPGFGPLQESMVQNAYGTDFQMGGPIGKPPGDWGPLITTVIGSGLTAYGGCMLLHCDLDYGTQASVQPQVSVSGTSQLSPSTVNTSSPIQWDNISYTTTPVHTQTNYSTASSPVSTQGGGGYSAAVSSYISVLQQTVSVLQSIVRSYGATPVK